MNGKGKYVGIDGVERSGGISSSNKLHDSCYLLRNGEPGLMKSSCLLLSNPHSGPTSALAPTLTPTLQSLVENKDMVHTQQMTTSGPVSALAPIPTHRPVWPRWTTRTWSLRKLQPHRSLQAHSPQAPPPSRPRWTTRTRSLPEIRPTRTTPFTNLRLPERFQ